MSAAICPVCNRTFLESKLEAHVNKCLDGDGASDAALFESDGSEANAAPKDFGSGDFVYGKSEEKSNSLIGKKRSADEMTDEEFARFIAEEENQTAGTILCQSCNKTFVVDSIYILDECSHKFCKPCIRTYIEDKVATDITIACPVKGCGKELSVRDTKEFMPKKPKTSHGGGLVPKNSTGKATERLYAELTHLLKGEPEKQVRCHVSNRGSDLKLTRVSKGYSVEPLDDNIYHWELRFFDFDKSEPLSKDMKKMNVEHITLHITFPSTFPFAPPFIRVIRPRFVYRTGHVTIGGSICTELLTNKGWSPAITMESVIVTIRAQLCEGGARLDFANKRDYSEAEAKDAFQRMAQTHGWL